MKAVSARVGLVAGGRGDVRNDQRSDGSRRRRAAISELDASNDRSDHFFVPTDRFSKGDNVAVREGCWDFMFQSPGGSFTWLTDMGAMVGTEIDEINLFV